MQLVSQVLGVKGHDVYSVTPDTTVFDALKLMAEKNIGAVIVRENSDVVGIMSERDYARKVILVGKSSKNIPVREIMSTRVFYVRPDQTIEDCMILMINKRIRHLPVMRDKELLGVLSIGDVVNAIIAEREYIIEQLENYIAGRYYTPKDREDLRDHIE